MRENHICGKTLTVSEALENNKNEMKFIFCLGVQKVIIKSLP